MGKYFLKDFFVQSRDLGCILKDNTQNEAILSTKNSLYLNFLKTCFEQHSPHPLISNFQKSVAKCLFFNLRKLPVPLSPEFFFFFFFHLEQTVKTPDSLKPPGCRFCFDKLYIKSYFQSHQRLLFCHSAYCTWTAFKGSE